MRPQQTQIDEVAVRNYLQLMARHERVMEIAQQLTSSIDLGTLLGRIIKAAADLTDTEGASILLVDQLTGDLRFEAASGMSVGAMGAIVVPTQASIAGWVVLNCQPVLVEDTSTEPRFFRGVDEMTGNSTRNLLAIPMIARDKVIGVVEVINKREGYHWSDDDVDDLMTFASQATIAIQNMRPYSVENAIKFYSCFISYSHLNENFTRHLWSKLREAKITVWFAPENIQGGKKLNEQVDQAIEYHDKLLLVLSDYSINSKWVITELRKALAEEQANHRRKLFPLRLTSIETLKAWKCFDADTGKDLAVEIREYYIPDFSQWKNNDAFEAEFQRLLRDLQANELEK